MTLLRVENGKVIRRSKQYWKKSGPFTRNERVEIQGLAELNGIRRGQVWSIERSLTGSIPPQLCVVTSISRLHVIGTQYKVYLHNIKTGRLVLKDFAAMKKGKKCRLVRDCQVQDSFDLSELRKSFQI